MKPRASAATPAASAPMRRSVGLPSDRDQHRVEHLGLRALLAFVSDPQALRLGLDRRHLRLEKDLVVELADPLGERRDDVGIGARHQLVHHLDHRDPGAERVIDRRHFEADDAAAEDQHPLGDEPQLERRGRIPDARIGRDEAGRDRFGARGDDRLGEAHDPRPLRRLDAHGVGGSELALAPDDSHFALAGEACEAAPSAA